MRQILAKILKIFCCCSGGKGFEEGNWYLSLFVEIIECNFGELLDDKFELSFIRLILIPNKLFKFDQSQRLHYYWPLSLYEYVNTKWCICATLILFYSCHCHWILSKGLLKCNSCTLKKSPLRLFIYNCKGYFTLLTRRILRKLKINRNRWSCNIY